MADKTKYAETTTSEYYTIGCIKVRISDHMSCNTDSDLAIFDNGKSTYVVVPMIGTYKQVQWFTKISEVTEFITQFEKFAKFLVKPIVTTMKEEVKETVNNMQHVHKITAINKLLDA